MRSKHRKGSYVCWGPLADIFLLVRFAPKADIDAFGWNVRFVPIAGFVFAVWLAARFSTEQA